MDIFPMCSTTRRFDYWLVSVCTLSLFACDSNRIAQGPGKYNLTTFGDTPHYQANNTGWSDDDIDRWYSLTQGSRLIPERWFKALEQPDSDSLFIEPANLKRYGYILLNDELPVGFITDTWDKADELGTYSKPTTATGDKWIGMNCSACHTGQYLSKGKRFVVHGAPAMSDFLSLTAEIVTALEATLNDADKFERFFTEIKTQSGVNLQKTQLRAELGSYLTWRKSFAEKNGNQVPSNYGYGRLDAVGHILNTVSLVAAKNTSSEWPSDAPVSYPHIWNAPQHEFVQWNGLAANDTSPITLRKKPTDIGALGRNAGEVTGVFADLNVTGIVGQEGFDVKSSANARHLIDLEQTLGRLNSPKWPFGPLDEQLVAEGKALFISHCASCHSHLEPEDTKTRLPLADERSGIEPKIVLNWLHETGTDIWMACNTDQHSVPRNDAGEIIAAEPNVVTSGTTILTTVVERSLKNQALYIAGSVLEDLFGTGGAQRDPASFDPRESDPEAFVDIDKRKRARAIACLQKSVTADTNQVDVDYIKAKRKLEKTNRILRLLPFVAKKAKKQFEAAEKEYVKYQLLRYKARPLNGIWATAPYLHNGSVPTLYDLLLPSNHSDATGFALLAEETRIPGVSPSSQNQIREKTKTAELAWKNAKSKTSERRPDCFYVGNLEYDIDKGGYISPSCENVDAAENAQLSKFEVTKVISNSEAQVISGNSNAGHHYPTRGLEDSERTALLEYLKQL